MNGLKQPLISIIVPVYKVEKYLERCVNSILAQDYPNLEVILVDDGSPDNCGQIADNYAKTDSRIIVVHQENQGLSGARNTGLDMARGELIGFVDSDDWIEKDMFSSLYHDMETNNADASLCGYHIVNIDDENNVSDMVNFIPDSLKDSNDFKPPLVLSNKQDIFGCLLGKITPPAWAILYKKELFAGIRFPMGKVHEDLYVTHRLFDRASRITISPDPKYYYLIRPGSISHSSETHLEMLFNSLGGAMDQYEHISLKCPGLTKKVLKNVYKSLLFLISNMRSPSELSLCRDRIYGFIDKIRTYPYANCDLSPEDEYMLKMVLSEMRHVAMSAMLGRLKGGRNESRV